MLSFGAAQMAQANGSPEGSVDISRYFEPRTLTTERVKGVHNLFVLNQQILNEEAQHHGRMLLIRASHKQEMNLARVRFELTGARQSYTLDKLRRMLPNGDSPNQSRGNAGVTVYVQ